MLKKKITKKIYYRLQNKSINGLNYCSLKQLSFNLLSKTIVMTIFKNKNLTKILTLMFLNLFYLRTVDLKP